MLLSKLAPGFELDHSFLRSIRNTGKQFIQKTGSLSTYCETIVELPKHLILLKKIAWTLPKSMGYRLALKAARDTEGSYPVLGEGPILETFEEVATALASVWEYSGHLLPLRYSDSPEFESEYQARFPDKYLQLSQSPEFSTLRDEKLASPSICPVTTEELTKALQDIEQGTLIWHLMRRFYIGATRLKNIVQKYDDYDKTPMKERTVLHAAKSILGLAPGETFCHYVKRALCHGSSFEDMARDGYCAILKRMVPTMDISVVEYGMSVAPYLPHFFAQSPDGVIVDRKKDAAERIGMIEIKCQYMRDQPYPKCPTMYMMQVIQGTLAHDTPYCDFISMLYRVDTDHNFEHANDPDIVRLTVERITVNALVRKAFSDYMVTFAYYVQLLAEESLHTVLLPGGNACKNVRKCRLSLESHLMDLQPKLHKIIDDEIQRCHFPHIASEFDTNVWLSDKPLKLLEDFFCGDKALCDKWRNTRANMANIKTPNDSDHERPESSRAYSTTFSYALYAHCISIE